MRLVVFTQYLREKESSLKSLRAIFIFKMRFEIIANRQPEESCKWLVAAARPLPRDVPVFAGHYNNGSKKILTRAFVHCRGKICVQIFNVFVFP